MQTEQTETKSKKPTLKEVIDAEKHGRRDIAIDLLLDVDDLQSVLNLPSKNWIYQKIHSGTLPFPFVKAGHYVRFPLSGVQR